MRVRERVDIHIGQLWHDTEERTFCHMTNHTGLAILTSDEKNPSKDKNITQIYENYSTYIYTGTI